MQRQPWQPTVALKNRPLGKTLHEPDTEVGDRNDPFRNAENGAKCRRFHNTHPPNTDPFRSRRQPQILNRAASAIHRRFWNRVPPDHRRPEPLLVAGHTEVERRIKDPFQLEGEILLAAFLIERLRCTQPFNLDMGTHLGADLAILDHKKVPRLREPNRPGLMRC